MAKAICCICKKGIEHVGVLHRVNATGKPGIWACEKHLKQTDQAPVDEDVRTIVDVLLGRPT